VHQLYSLPETSSIVRAHIRRWVPFCFHSSLSGAFPAFHLGFKTVPCIPAAPVQLVPAAPRRVTRSQPGHEATRRERKKRQTPRPPTCSPPSASVPPNPLPVNTENRQSAAVLHPASDERIAASAFLAATSFRRGASTHPPIRHEHRRGSIAALFVLRASRCIVSPAVTRLAGHNSLFVTRTVPAQRIGSTREATAVSSNPAANPTCARTLHVVRAHQCSLRIGRDGASFGRFDNLAMADAVR
jgi:hypothetical protein